MTFQTYKDEAGYNSDNVNLTEIRRLGHAALFRRGDEL